MPLCYLLYPSLYSFFHGTQWNTTQYEIDFLAQRALDRTQQALVDREDTAIVFGPFLRTLNSTPAFLREEALAIQNLNDGDSLFTLKLSQSWLRYASILEEILQVSFENLPPIH